MAAMLKKMQDRTKERTRQSKSVSVVTMEAGFVAAMFVMSSGITVPSFITQQQSAYAHLDFSDPGAHIYRISTQQDEDEDDDQNGGK